MKPAVAAGDSLGSAVVPDPWLFSSCLKRKITSGSSGSGRLPLVMAYGDRAWLEVDCSALRHNLAILRSRARVPLIAMLKADAYGLGAIGVARALGVPFADDEVVGTASGSLWGIGVSSLDEAESLLVAGCRGRLFCPTPLLPHELPRALRLGIRPSLHLAADIATWWTLGNGRAPYHLSIDTGMSRAGVRWDSVTTLRDAVRLAPPEGVFTHFHSADELPSTRDQQDRRFEEALAALAEALPGNVLSHRDNSGSIVGRDTGSPGELARPGIALYAGMFTRQLGLRQVAHVRARVVDVRDVQRGESVSYGADWTAHGNHRIATISIGYADGFRRHFSNAADVLIHGTLCPVVGRVTMDMIMVDVSAVACSRGDVATLLGADGTGTLTPEAVSVRAGVSSYELLTGLSQRLPPVYSDAISSVAEIKGGMGPRTSPG